MTTPFFSTTGLSGNGLALTSILTFPFVYAGELGVTIATASRG